MTQEEKENLATEKLYTSKLSTNFSYRRAFILGLDYSKVITNKLLKDMLECGAISKENYNYYYQKTNEA